MGRQLPTRVLTIDHLVRMRSSSVGNPRFYVHFTDGTVAATEVNSGWAYGAEDEVGRPIEVTFTRSGFVAYAKPATA